MPLVGSPNLFCMAGDECRTSETLISPSNLHLLILFFLLLLVHVTGEQQGDLVMEDQRQSNNDGGTANIKSNNTQESREAGGNKLHHSRAHLHGSVKEDELFNNTKHEVPSGPNPISNSLSKGEWTSLCFGLQEKVRRGWRERIQGGCHHENGFNVDFGLLPLGLSNSSASHTHRVEEVSTKKN